MAGHSPGARGAARRAPLRARPQPGPVLRRQRAPAHHPARRLAARAARKPDAAALPLGALRRRPCRPCHRAPAGRHPLPGALDRRTPGRALPGRAGACSDPVRRGRRALPRRRPCARDDAPPRPRPGHRPVLAARGPLRQPGGDRLGQQGSVLPPAPGTPGSRRRGAAMPDRTARHPRQGAGRDRAGGGGRTACSSLRQPARSGRPRLRCGARSAPAATDGSGGRSTRPSRRWSGAGPMGA
jgi:hypothetical protein